MWKILTMSQVNPKAAQKSFFIRTRSERRVPAIDYDMTIAGAELFSLKLRQKEVPGTGILIDSLETIVI